MKESVFLFLYASCKAFLPIPSLEVVLIPMTLLNPNRLVWYICISTVGTMVGASLAYIFASCIEENKLRQFIGPTVWDKGKQTFLDNGILAVIVIAITPIPDFILAYLAGFLRMNYVLFIITDALSRMLRSIAILYCLIQLGININIDKFGNYMIILMLVYFGIRIIKSYRAHR